MTPVAGSSDMAREATSRSPVPAAPRSAGNRRAAPRVAALVVLAAVVVAGHVWYRNRHNFFDLRIYREAMRWWDSGHHLYDYSRPDATQGHLEFTYPPFAAYLLRPLAWLSWGQSVAIYSIVALASFAVVVVLLSRSLSERLGEPWWFVFGLVFVLSTGLEPIREAFTFGQINFVLWALIVVDLLVLGVRGSRFAGVGIGLASAIKLVPAVFILYLLVRRQWRAAGVAVATAALATAVAWLAAPHDSWVFWGQKVRGSDGIGQVQYTFNQSIMGVLARLSNPPNTLLWLVLALPLLGYGLWRAGRAAAAGDEVSGLTLTGLAGSLASPVTWVHHIVWFIPALVVLVETSLTADRSDRRRRSVLLGWAAVVYLTVTFSVVAIDEFTLGHPGGLVGFVLGNWDAWLMLALLPTLPIRSTSRVAAPQPAR
jgi:alpha-1,2-mannosyltransferase